jgi:hypothetical protein
MGGFSVVGCLYYLRVFLFVRVPLSAHLPAP